MIRFVCVTVECTDLNDNIGRITSKGDNLFELEYKSDLFKLLTNDNISIEICTGFEKELFDQADYVIQGKVLCSGDNNEQQYIVISFGGLLGKFRASQCTPPIKLNVTNEDKCVLYLTIH